MHPFRPILAIAGLSFGGMIPANAQNILFGTAEPGWNGGTFLRATFDGPPRSLAAVVLNAPYSAEQVRQRTQTLADGSRIVEQLPSAWMFRDSQGRRRMESSLLTGPKGEPGLDIVEIRDFAAGYEYTLDPANRIAHRLRMPPDVQQSRAPNTVVVPLHRPFPSADAAPAQERTKVVNQSLGTQTIEGSVSDGRKVFTVVPAGLEGNDRPLVSTDETWIAQDLKMVIQSRRDNPREGLIVTKLVNIHRSEPDPSLFRIPADYRIVDEDGRFTIEVTRVAGEAIGTPEDEQAVRRVIARMADARNAFDAPAMMETYADNAVFGSFGVRPIEGRTNIAALWSSALTHRDGQASRTVKNVRFVRPDVAIVMVDVHFVGPRGPIDFEEIFQVGKNVGRWQIRAQNSKDRKVQ